MHTVLTAETRFQQREKSPFGHKSWKGLESKGLVLKEELLEGPESVVAAHSSVRKWLFS
jgi:hypothetical protein